ncbi:HAD family hydrolase [Actinokineospora enzanensis]|uniref:HAD family hydrolase n=1 Tax=Actinokineospora enzanensis TaxID=155975 RepID=UPI00037C0641|nr:HAD family phosphatase [Actinokineospora enzanensis]
MTTAVLFDLDGVIIDSRAAIEASWAEVLARYAGRELTERDIHEHVHGRLGDHTVAALFPDHTADKRAAIWVEAGEIEARTDFTFIPGARAMLDALVERGIPVALVTGSGAEKVARVKSLLDNPFTRTVTREDVTKGKPHPEPYLKACELLGVPPEHAVVFEDSHSGVRAAVAAGARCVGIGDPDLIREGALHTVPDFTHLTLSTADGTHHLSGLPSPLRL